MLTLQTHGAAIAQSYSLDVEESKIYWTGRKQLFGNPVTQEGELKFQSGTIRWQNNTFTYAKLVIDMNSITHLNDGKVYTDNDVVNHLKSESCFCVKKNPQALFKLHTFESESADDNNCVGLVTGTLTIKDIIDTVSFNAKVVRSKGTLFISAALPISRKAFQLDLEPFLIRIGGDRIVQDRVDIVVEIAAHQLPDN